MNYTIKRKEVYDNLKQKIDRSFKLLIETYLSGLKILIGMFLEKNLTLHENIIAENIIKIIWNNQFSIILYFSKEILLISGTLLFLLIFFDLIVTSKEEKNKVIKDIWLHSLIICLLIYIWHSI